MSMYWYCAFVGLCYCTNVIAYSQNLMNQSMRAANNNNKMIGPFDLLFREIEECPNIGSGDLRFQIRLKRFNRTTISADFNITFKIDYNDDIVMGTSLAVKTNGGFKQNFLNFNLSQGCKSFFHYTPRFAKKFGAAVKSGCPIPKGYYSAKDFVPQKEKLQQDSFFYNTYRITIVFYKKSKKVGCLKAIMDIVPKKNV